MVEHLRVVLEYFVHKAERVDGFQAVVFHALAQLHYVAIGRIEDYALLETLSLEHLHLHNLHPLVLVGASHVYYQFLKTVFVAPVPPTGFLRVCGRG